MKFPKGQTKAQPPHSDTHFVIDPLLQTSSSCPPPPSTTTTTTTASSPLTDVTMKTSSPTDVTMKTLVSPNDVTKKTWSPSSPSTSLLMTHIYVLYSVVAVLSGSLVATLWLGSCRLASIQHQLDGKLSFKEWARTPHHHQHQQSIAPLHNDTVDSSGTQPVMGEDFLELWNEVPKKNARKSDGQRGAGEGHRAGKRSRTRSRREAEPDQSVDNPDDWVWMSSFSRIPNQNLLEKNSAKIPEGMANKDGDG
ncbi:hypothetical protein ACOMHN_033000 [Nucella lapillus]